MSWGAVAAVGASVVGGMISSDAAGSAADAQAGSAAASDATQRYMYDTTRADNQQFLQTGQQANKQLATLLGLSGDSTNRLYGSLNKQFTAQDMYADPIYASGFETALRNGNQGINRLAAAGGTLNSGATLKALSRFGAETANNYGNDAFNRFNTNQTNQYNRLAGVSGAGQTSANTIGAAGSNAANVISNNATSLGNARAASAIGTGNAINGGISNALSSYQNNQLMNRLFGGTNSVTPTIYGTNALNAPASSMSWNTLVP